MRKLLAMAALLAVLLGTLVGAPGAAQSYVGRAPAPEFPPGLDWINTDRELTLEELRGKIVLLDFWTYGCINCIHVIPDLRALETKYERELVVIGVHSAKFYNESETANIRMIAQRYDRTHPIVNDSSFAIWSQYSIRAWPSFILIDPDGNVLGRHEGEGIYDLFDEVIAGMIQVFEERGTLDRTPLELNLEAVTPPRTALRFPGHVLADPLGGRLFISDSGHNRIVVTDFSGTVTAVIGNGEGRLQDGGYAQASFNRPQGMALAGPDSLYVADTGNHSVRLVNLRAGTVVTVAGNGSQEYLFGRSSAPASGGLNSPWDVLWLNGELFIAMAGQHQVWRYVPLTQSVELHAGSGREELRDGVALLGGLNQPSGLATDGELLFVADSEASAVRQVDVAEGGNISTLVGTGLFGFGDADGVGSQALLQHPKDVAYAEGLLYVADTYNHKIKVLDPITRESTSLLGSGVEGWQDGAGDEARFYEPGGLSVMGRSLYVADTNNHAVRVANLDSLVVRTLTLTDPNGLLMQEARRQVHYDEVVEVPGMTTTAGKGTVALTLSLPEGYKANLLAPLQVSVSFGVGADQGLDAQTITVAEPEYPLTLEFDVLLTAGQAQLNADVLVYYCREVAAELCLIRHALLEIPVTVTAAGTADAASADQAGEPSVALTWQPPALPPGY
ncbi:MAG: thioredoxin-like domain-containing protein [Trueperaceae bacterium]